MKESTGEEWKGEKEELPDILEILNDILNMINRPIDLNGPAPMSTYVLDGEIIRKPESYKEYLDFMENGRRVALDFVGDSYVSTVFLCIDHNFTGKGSPILFETMTFHNGRDIQRRYSTYEEALTGHREELEALQIAEANGL